MPFKNSEGSEGLKGEFGRLFRGYVGFSLGFRGLGFSFGFRV